MARKSGEPMAADQARFYLALGAVGYVRPAAELAEVPLEQAWRWVEGLERPPWTCRRAEAAIHLFAVATEALERVRRLICGEEPEPGATGLRDWVMVAERFYRAALQLDKDVAADGQGSLELDLDGWSAGPAERARPAASAPGAEDRD